MPQNWLFLTSYKKQREDLLRRVRWDLLARLGPGAFETISGEVVQAVLLTQTHAKPDAQTMLHGVDASAPKSALEKAELLGIRNVVAVSQLRQLGNPDARVALDEPNGGALLETYARCIQGLRPADRGLLVRNFWELPHLSCRWTRLQSSSESTQYFGGMEGAFDLATFDVKWRELGSAYKGHNQWGQAGICMSQMSSLPATLYTGAVYDGNINVFDIKTIGNLPAISDFLIRKES